MIEFGDAQAVFNSVCKQMNRLNWSAVKAKRLQKEKEDEKEKEKEREKAKEHADKRKTLVGDCVAVLPELDAIEPSSACSPQSSASQRHAASSTIDHIDASASATVDTAARPPTTQQCLLEKRLQARARRHRSAAAVVETLLRPSVGCVPMAFGVVVLQRAQAMPRATSSGVVVSRLVVSRVARRVARRDIASAGSGEQAGGHRCIVSLTGLRHPSPAQPRNHHPCIKFGRGRTVISR